MPATFCRVIRKQGLAIANWLHVLLHLGLACAEP